MNRLKQLFSRDDLTYEQLEDRYLPLDKQRINKRDNLKLIPNLAARTGGNRALVEYAHTVGVFETLLKLHNTSVAPVILDVGCGAGLCGIAAEPLLRKGGRWIGIDVVDYYLGLGREVLTGEQFEFRHVAAKNATFAPDQTERVPWDIPDASMDIVTALSVWTHFNEADAVFNLQEVCRVLKPGGFAMLTFFILDEYYRPGISTTFHGKPLEFSVACSPNGWFTPAWAEHPEDATAIKRESFDALLEKCRLTLETMHVGGWKIPTGVYYQDVAILRNNR